MKLLKSTFKYAFISLVAILSITAISSLIVKLFAQYFLGLDY